jgi:hypothetical protein
LSRRLSSKAQVGARYVARMRGAFNAPRSAVPSASEPDKPEAKAGAVNATRANVGETGAKSEAKPASV